MQRTDLAIIGGGIAGLAAAYYAARDATGDVRISLLEAGDRWGGKILTRRQSGFVMEGGPDAFLVTKTWAPALAAAAATAKPIRPELRLLINRTGSIASRVGPAVISTFNPRKTSFRLQKSTTRSRSCKGSSIRP